MNITKYMQYTKIVFFTLLLASNALVGSERLMIGSSLHAPEKLGQVALGYDKDGFRIIQNGQVHAIKNYHVDPVLRNISSDHLEAFLKHGYISVSQFDDEEFALRAHVRGVGGGPFTGMCAAWFVRSVSYAAGAAVVAGASAGTGGAAPLVAGTAGVAAVNAYIATTEGAASAAFILGYACFWLP